MGVRKPESFRKVQADMSELADAPDLGSGVHDVQVQVLLSAFDQFPEMLKEDSISGNYFFGQLSGSLGYGETF